MKRHCDGLGAIIYSRFLEGFSLTNEFVPPTKQPRRAGTCRLKRSLAAATPTTQWRSNPSPPIVSSKTGISAVRTGDFWEILAEVTDFWIPGDRDHMQKSP